MTQLQPQSASLDDANVALVLHDGRKLLKDGTVVSEVAKPSAQLSTEIMSGRRALQTMERMHRKLGDLPDIPQAMNPIAAIIVYTCIGLSDADIATALQAEEAQIQTIKQSAAFSKLFELFDQSVFQDAKRNAQHIIARSTDRAATRLTTAIESDDPLISLAASKEVLKLGGISLEQDSGNKMSGLHIRITSKEDTNINVEIKDA